MRVYSTTVKSRLGAVMFTLLVLGLAAGLLLVGFALLAALAAGGAVFGTGVAIYRRLRGKRAPVPRHRGGDLDPSLEVFPMDRNVTLPSER